MIYARMPSAVCIHGRMAGYSALVRASNAPGWILCQFDARNIAGRHNPLAFGWHAFQARHFMEMPL